MKKNNKYIGILFFISIVICLIIIGTTQENQKPKPQPKLYEFNGIRKHERPQEQAPDFGELPMDIFIDASIVPKVTTPGLAVQISSIIFKAIHGENLVATYKRYKVTLINNRVWLVRGYNTIVHSTLMIQKNDGRVLHISMNPNKKQNKQYKEDIERLLIQINRLKKDNNYISKYGYTPDSTVYELPNGVIKDARTAAEVGYEIIDFHKSQPIQIELYDKTLWYIKGTLSGGGTGNLSIQKSDGRIIAIYYEKN